LAEVRAKVRDFCVGARGGERVQKGKFQTQLKAWVVVGPWLEVKNDLGECGRVGQPVTIPTPAPVALRSATDACGVPTELAEGSVG